jgi:hypothetical protein
MLNVVKANLLSQPTNELMHFFSWPVSELIDAVAEDHFAFAILRLAASTVSIGTNCEDRIPEEVGKRDSPTE